MKSYRSLIIPLVAIVLLFTAVYSFIPGCEKGNGKVETRTFVLDDFNKISINGSADVTITQGENQLVKVTGESNILDLLTKKVDDGEWKVGFDKCVKYRKEFSIHVTTPHIEEVEINGSGDIHSEGQLICDDLEIEINGSGNVAMDVQAQVIESKIKGSGDIQLTGTTGRHDISIKGSGSVSSIGLSSTKCDVEIKGSGDVTVNVSDQLKGSIYGSGDIHYKKGVKEVKFTNRGSGSVQPIDI